MSDLRSQNCAWFPQKWEKLTSNLNQSWKTQCPSSQNMEIIDVRSQKNIVGDVWSQKKSGETGGKAAKIYEKRRVLEKIPGQLEASFVILLTLGSITQSNTQCFLINMFPVTILTGSASRSRVLLSLVLCSINICHGACLWPCVLFCCFSKLVCLFAYTYDYKSIAGGPSRWELHGHLITARHSNVFSTLREG